MNSIPVVTIDGPSGSGKGTLAKAVAEALGWHLLDSGALYRGLAYYASQQAADLSNSSEMGRLARALPIRFETHSPSHEGSEGVSILIDDQLCTQALRTETTGRLASQVAAYPEVREGLLALQLGFRRAPGLVADGRDMGTVIFPDAPFKFFLTASAQARAQRRYQQLKKWAELKGQVFGVSLAALEGEVRARDERDQNRTVAPLIPAEDAVVIDSSDMSINEVFSAMMKGIKPVSV